MIKKKIIKRKIKLKRIYFKPIYIYIYIVTGEGKCCLIDV